MQQTNFFKDEEKSLFFALFFQNFKSNVFPSCSILNRLTFAIHLQKPKKAPGISAKPHDDNIRYFDVIIAGPDNTPYQGSFCIHHTQ